MKISKSLLLLFLITAIGFFLRFYKLGEIPAGLYLDEAAQGYNAYSILKTGKDEFGKSFPIVFRSFADFKTPIYIYLIVPLIPIFDLTKFTVRFPSFFFSVLTFPLLYFLLRWISPNKDKSLALISTFLLAISPWHILFGRTNFECNVALFFLLFGIYFFYLGLKKPLFFIFSALLLGISFSAYHSERIITPIITVILLFRHRSVIFQKNNRNYLIVSFIIGLLVVIPTISLITTPGFSARINTLNIFSQSRTPYDSLLLNQSSLSWIFNNRLLLNLQEFLSLYLSYFSPRNMFYLGDYGPRSSFPELATFYLWQFPFYLSGIFFLIKQKDLKELRFLIITLFFLSPLPASLTSDPYSTIRSLPLVIPQVVIIGLGIKNILNYLRNTFQKLIGIVSLTLLISFSILHFFSSAFILNEYFRAKEWDYGWKEVVDKINTLDPNLPIIVDNARGEGYSQLLFFLKPDPATYQQNNFEVNSTEYYSNMNRQTTKHFNRITTRNIVWIKDTKVKQYLIGDYLSISEDQIRDNKLQLIAEIKYPDNSPAFRIIQTNP
jgi:4-amino-4-deoxy-L-arabinose transferase-like glycosyltransferase